jgi:AraC-like DNA-binding protein
MPTADSFMHGLDGIEAGAVWHQIDTVYGIEPRTWITSTHEACVIDYVDTDGIVTKVSGWNGGREFARPPRRWHFYAARTTYSEAYEKPRRIREDAWFFFSLKAPLLPFSGRTFAAIDDLDGRLLAHCRAMVEHDARGDAPSALVKRGLFAAIIGEVMLAAQHGDGSPERPWRVHAGSTAKRVSLLDQLDRLLKPRLADPPSVGKIAEALHLSTSALSHRLKSESGVTVVERIRWLRIREAQRLLIGGMSSKEIAHRLGFSSPPFFSRVFRDVVGASPIDYLRQLRKN